MSIEDVHVEPPGPSSMRSRYGRKRPESKGVSALTASLLVLVSLGLGAVGAYHYLQKTVVDVLAENSAIQRKVIGESNEALLRSVLEADRENSAVLTARLKRANEAGRAALLAALTEADKQSNGALMQALLEENQQYASTLEERVLPALSLLETRLRQLEEQQRSSREQQSLAAVTLMSAGISARVKDLIGIIALFEQEKKRIPQNTMTAYDELEQLVKAYPIEQFLHHVGSLGYGEVDNDTGREPTSLDYESSIKIRLFYNRLQSIEQLLVHVHETRTEQELMEQVDANTLSGREGYARNNISLLYAVMTERNRVVSQLLNRVVDVLKLGADALILLDDQLTEHGGQSLVEQEDSTLAGQIGAIQELIEQEESGYSFYSPKLMASAEALTLQVY